MLINPNLKRVFKKTTVKDWYILSTKIEKILKQEDYKLKSLSTKSYFSSRRLFKSIQSILIVFTPGCVSFGPLMMLLKLVEAAGKELIDWL